MATSLTFVVSGKKFPEVPKDCLIKSSLYYRTLLGGNYKDSHDLVYKFSGWSTKALDFLLQFIVTGRIMFKGLKLDVILAAMKMSDYLLVDEFKVELTRSLITSWTELDVGTAFQLAEELDVLESLREYSFIRVLSAVEREEHCRLRGLNFDILILATGMDGFWNYHKDRYETCEHRWNEVIQRVREVLEPALKLPPNSYKSKALTANLRIHWFHEPYRSTILEMLDCSQPVSWCLRTAFEEHLAVSRQNLRKLFSHVRIPFERVLDGRGVLEFNMNAWCWEVKEYNDSFKSLHCVMYRNNATFLCTTGLFVIRKFNASPEFLRNAQLGELMDRSSQNVSCCCLGRFIYLLVCSNNNQEIPVLYKYNVFSNEFSTCTSVPFPVSKAKIKSHGDILYIVGYEYLSLEYLCSLCVMEYNMKTSKISVVASSFDLDFDIEELFVVERKLYIFSREAYTIVDTLKDKKQRLKFRSYTGFFRGMWNFELLGVTHTSNDIYLFLSVSSNDWYSFYLMVAQFNPLTGEIICLGFIPTTSVEKYFRYWCFGKYFKPQIELRHPRDGPPPDSHEILKELKRFE